MTVSVGCDMHQNYSIFSIWDENGLREEATRVEHEGEDLQQYLEDLPEGASVAVEAGGGWYRMIDAMEEAGLEPKLTDPHQAKLMMGNVDKTDKLDAEGLAKLEATGTLPEVWIPSQEIRDRRELLRCRMKLVGDRTSHKNRVRATLDKYGVSIPSRDLFGGGESRSPRKLEELPPEHRRAVRIQLSLIEGLTDAIDELTDRIRETIQQTPSMKRLQTIPGVGTILSALIALEVGDVERFPSGAHLASYAGTVPRVHASGGTVRHGSTKSNVNHKLKWGYAEAANSIVSHKQAWSQKHVVQLYERIEGQKNHGVAIGAVSRHLAEATWHILAKEESYRDPNSND